MHPALLSPSLLSPFHPSHPHVPHYRDEGGRRCLRHCLGHHRFPRPGGAVHENTAGRIDPDLLVQLKVCQGELHGLLDFLGERKGEVWEKGEKGQSEHMSSGVFLG